MGEEDNSTFGHKLAYDDAFIQVALKAQQHKKHRQYAPDDDDFDFAEDDGDDPSNFSVEQFIGDDNDNGDVSTESDNDDDDSDYSFAQRNSGPGGKKKKKRARRNRKKKAKKQAAAAGSTTDATAAGGSQTEPAAGGSTTGSTATAASGNTASTTAAATAKFNSVDKPKKKEVTDKQGGRPQWRPTRDGAVKMNKHEKKVNLHGVAHKSKWVRKMKNHQKRFLGETDAWDNNEGRRNDSKWEPEREDDDDDDDDDDDEEDGDFFLQTAQRPQGTRRRGTRRQGTRPQGTRAHGHNSHHSPKPKKKTDGKFIVTGNQQKTKMRYARKFNHHRKLLGETDASDNNEGKSNRAAPWKADTEDEDDDDDDHDEKSYEEHGPRRRRGRFFLQNKKQ